MFYKQGFDGTQTYTLSGLNGCVRDYKLAKTEISTVWPLAKVCLLLRDTILTSGSSAILTEPEPALKVTSHLHCKCELSGSSILLFSQMSHQFPSAISRFVAWGSLFSRKLKSDNVRSSEAQ